MFCIKLKRDKKNDKQKTDNAELRRGELLMDT